MKGVLVELHSVSEASLLAQSWDAKALKDFPNRVIFEQQKWPRIIRLFGKRPKEINGPNDFY